MNKYMQKLLQGKTQRELASELGVSHVLVYRWLHELQKVPAYMALRIHKITGGQIKYYQIRPDLDKIDT